MDVRTTRQCWMPNEGRQGGVVGEFRLEEGQSKVFLLTPHMPSRNPSVVGSFDLRRTRRERLNRFENYLKRANHTYHLPTGTLTDDRQEVRISAEQHYRSVENALIFHNNRRI